MLTGSRNAAVEFQRWELPKFAEQSSEAVEAAPPPQPTVRDLEAIEQQAREEGYAAGLVEGRAAADAQLKRQMSQLVAVFDAAAQPLASLDARTAQELVRLATLVASRVIGRELQLSPTLIAQTVREGAAALPSANRELRIRLHPDDVSLLRELNVSEEHWQLNADPTLVRGDCQMDSGRSRLDLRVKTRLAAVVDAVLGDDVEQEDLAE
ncbi:MAG TPA: flagellar assembly protein FliH [Rhodanobacter sp.]|nr:flagellar assembly protein FliH [Rhodanobacter sp.]